MGKGRKKMGKGRKKRSPKSVESTMLPASADDKKVGTGGFPGPGPSQQVKPVVHELSNAERGNWAEYVAAPCSESETGATFNGGSSFSAMPKKASSVPCRYFQRGYCWNGDYCRFQHLECLSIASSNPTASYNPTPKATPRKERAPEECLDWYLTGSCPRLRTCRYAHPLNMEKDEVKDGSRKAPGRCMNGLDFMVNEMIRCGLDGSYGSDLDGDMDKRMRNGGFTDDDVYDLSLQGIKPWDPEAWDALAVLNGWDMDDYGFGDGYGDYSDYEF